jgi:hypothetical protein
MAEVPLLCIEIANHASIRKLVFSNQLIKKTRYHLDLVHLVYKEEGPNRVRMEKTVFLLIELILVTATLQLWDVKKLYQPDALFHLEYLPMKNDQ